MRISLIFLLVLLLFSSSIASADEPTPAPPSQTSTPTAVPAASTNVSPSVATAPAIASTPVAAVAAPVGSALPTCQELKAFKDKLHAAIDDALKYPAELKFRPASGVTIVAYDYGSGQVSNVRITQWSGDSRLDRAALAAVKNADYASITPGIGAQRFHDSVIVVFDNSANTDKNAAQHEKKKDPASQPCS